jgi:hypothetical protein
MLLSIIQRTRSACRQRRPHVRVAAPILHRAGNIQRLHMAETPSSIVYKRNECNSEEALPRQQYILCSGCDLEQYYGDACLQVVQTNPKICFLTFSQID